MKENYLNIAITAALHAGRKISEIYNDPSSDFEIERKADNSPLTIADRSAHNIIMSYLEKTSFPILSEEGKHLPFEERKKWDTLWIVDPLDGTKEFIKRNGEFTVNIALVHNEVPILGVIYVPIQKMLYFSDINIGAYKTGPIEYHNDLEWKKIIKEAKKMPSENPHPDKVIIVASRSHLSPETENYINKLKTQGKSVETISSGSSIKICLVADGVADLYPRFAPTMEWDTAAGHAIAIGSGKEIYQYEEEIPLQYNKENLLNPWFIVKDKQPENQEE
ncbi:3'(2'),5'-bisphosphate nucleotidase CysQ [Coprobacter tertius]|uniref:3'(2'),5'-bisphosphate nucleotidase CysQ n=1 Tax=Coprobacter tertius TaxID=2944915 RepID=A0ABT1MLR2_9BACT|nr:3'(2'),5'-bisphosphate nucleotidase CysQ [Coprobacter tertius]MCP9612836.1 3'(2'),5'-bisphosphate nucleotidase CysQ [Coprobacter tertius]